MNRPCFRRSVILLVVLLFPLLRAVAGPQGHGRLAAEAPSGAVPPNSAGKAKAQHATIAPNGIGSGGTALASSEELDNDEDAPPIPLGPLGKPRPAAPETQVEPAPSPGVDPDEFEIFRHCRVSDASGPIHGTPTSEPSGGVSDSGETGAPDCNKTGKKATRTVFATENKLAAFSADDGATFTKLNLTKIPNFIGSLCCDQVAVFIPKINRFVWVMLVRVTPKPGALQVMAAPPDKIVSSNGQSWSAWAIRPADLGFTTAGHFDFPGVAVGNNSLYVNVDGFGGMMVLRIPLEEIKAGGTLHLQFTDPKDSPRAMLGHTTEDAQDEVFWAQHNNTSQMRVFNWAEGSDFYEWRDVDVDPWSNDPNKMSSVTPDCQDWLSGTTPGRIRGAAHFKGMNTDDIWFAWTAARGESFQQPHVRWVKLDRKQNFKVADQGAIHNGKIAFAYPALATNSNGDVGISMEAGGGGGSENHGHCGGSFENHVVGFLGAGTLRTTTDSTQGIARFGDYVTIHRDTEDPSRFDAFGYGMEPSPTTHYLIFGKPPTASACSSCRCLDGYQPPGSLCFGSPSCQNACAGHTGDTSCVCSDGFKAGPGARAGTEACEHICRGHKSQPLPPQ